jgi:hypothetical protein
MLSSLICGGHLNPHPCYSQYKPINSIHKGLTISDQAQVTLQLTASLSNSFSWSNPDEAQKKMFHWGLYPLAAAMLHVTARNHQTRVLLLQDF